MRKKLNNNILRIIFASMVLLIASCGGNDDHAAHDDTYICPMHPTVVSDRPSTCPVCGMDLVRKARPGEEVEITDELARLIKSPNEVIIGATKTIRGTYTSRAATIQAEGVITYDARNLSTIPTRLGGRLEEVLIKFAYQPIRKGQKVASIYSPELVTAQRELIFLLENDAENKILIDGAKERLRLLGATDNQIATIVRTKDPLMRFSIYSPYSGYVVPDVAAAPKAPVPTSATASSGAMGGSMDNATAMAPGQREPAGVANAPLLIREGSYVSAGQSLFKLADSKSLLIELNLTASAAASVKKGNPVVLHFGNGVKQQGEVSLIEPFYQDGSNFVTVRVYVKEMPSLQIGSLVKATLETSSLEGLWVPREAVLDLGSDKVVFVKDKSVLKPRKVMTGLELDDQVLIQQGLSSSDEIAANAQFLVDSESFIKPVE